MINTFLSILSVFVFLSTANACPNHDQQPTSTAESAPESDITESD